MSDKIESIQNTNHGRVAKGMSELFPRNSF